MEIEELEKKMEMMNVEIESLIVSLDIIREVVECLDKIVVVIYKIYNNIKKVIDE